MCAVHAGSPRPLLCSRRASPPDICWSPDSKRIVVCGEGKDIFARAFLWDSGSSVGEVVGHSKSLNSCDFKIERPFRVVTASEDTDTGFYAGPPFKLDHLNTEHTNFVNSVRFSPDGKFYVSGGADGRAFLYDGREGKLVAEVGGGAEPAHKAGIYAVSWSPDSKRFISASADKSVKVRAGREKEGGGGVSTSARLLFFRAVLSPLVRRLRAFSLSPHSRQAPVGTNHKQTLATALTRPSPQMWEAESNTCVKTFSFPNTLENMQLGCLWQGEHIITVNLNGDITYLDEANPEQPKRVVKGHLKNITALAVADGGETFYAASSDGRTSRYSVKTGECTLMGAGYGANVTSLELVDGGLQVCWRRRGRGRGENGQECAARRDYRKQGIAAAGRHY